MLNRIKERYSWKNMRSDIENYVRKCTQCQSNKALRQINRAPMQITSTSTAPFERISLDIVGPLPEAGRISLKYILTLQDDLTKFSTAYPITNKNTYIYISSPAVLCQGIKHDDYIEQITSSPGIYFNPIGSVKLVNDYLHVVIPIDLEYIKPHINNINSVLHTSQHLCTKSNTLTGLECQNIFQPLIPMLEDLTRDYHSLSHLISSRSKRSAWIPGIGIIFKHIFGTMDEDDAIKYGNAIQQLKNNDKSLLNLVKENILISRTAIINFNETLIEINRNEKRLNDVIENLTSHINNMTIITNSILAKTAMQELFSALQSSLLSLSYRLEDIVNSILFAKTNTLHPSIITPKDLYNELVTNVKHLPKFSEFPVNLELYNIHIIIKLSEIISCILDNKLVYTIKIPLVLISPFNLYKVIPIPVAHNIETPSSFALIVPSASYIAMSRDKSEYCIFNDLNRNCNLIVKNSYICHEVAKFNIMNEPICETEIITKVIHSLPNECKINFISGIVHIWQNIGNNQWVFTHSEPTKLHIDCENENFDTILLGTGIVTLKPRCNGYCKNTKLIGTTNLTIKINKIFSDFNLINDTCCNLTTFNKLNFTLPLRSPYSQINSDNFMKLNIRGNLYP
ncbi:uncharacterized protein LOC123879838 [Maniola jurtina]|uniref:uncharacterized protein LOC123879838 n=1 Tax=Maniola jurtina TaxID=191418 RepID=UPI001E68D2C2|nr:uncharacterized protein LOC123879838 [Maniola jurtina]